MNGIISWVGGKKAFPYASTPERDVGMGAGLSVLIVAGGILVLLIVRPAKKRLADINK